MNSTQFCNDGNEFVDQQHLLVHFQNDDAVLNATLL
jgi:hypothetical protein